VCDAVRQERVVDLAEQLLEKDRKNELLAAEVSESARSFLFSKNEDERLKETTRFQVAQRSNKRKESKSRIRELTVCDLFSAFNRLKLTVT
jgi:transposase